MTYFIFDWLMFYCAHGVFVVQRAHLEGKKLGLEDEMRRIQRDLDSDLYRDADTRYLHRAADIKVNTGKPGHWLYLFLNSGPGSDY